jgi:ADP-heptose:LPS heptosyltransferase
LLVVGPHHIGDTIIALPALNSLVECERFKRVVLIVNNRTAPIVSSIINRIQCLPCPPVYHSWVQTTYHAARLALKSFHLGCTEVLDLRRDLISYAVSATIRVLALARESKSYVRDQAKVDSWDSEIHYSHEQYERLVAKALERRPRDLVTILETSRHLMARVIDGQNSPKLNGICLCPGASTRSKSWPLRNWISLADRLQKAGHLVSMVVGPNDNLGGIGIAIQASGTRILFDSSLLGAARNLARASIAITCDSALAHLAFAVGTPVLTLFGPTESSKWFPYHLVGGGITISPCSLPDCHPCQRLTCTSSTPCMTQLVVEDVATAICDYLGVDETGHFT